MSFGMERNKRLYEEYLGKYVVLHTLNKSFAGKITDLREGKAILNPHQTGEYSKSGSLKMCLLGEPSSVNISSIIAVEPTTKSSLEGYCNFRNKQESEKNNSNKDKNTKKEKSK